MDAVDDLKLKDNYYAIGGFYSLERDNTWKVKATPDGRKDGEPFSENQSPTYGADKNGITALLKSLSKLPFEKTATGGLNLTFSQNVSSDILKALVVSYFELGGLHIAIETCGFASDDMIKEISKYVDLFLFDYKETNSELHKKFTGTNNDIIFENLSLLNSMGKRIILRCPIIPGCNDRKEHFEGIGKIANKFEHIERIELEPYHSLGESKYISLGIREHKFSLPDDKEKESWLSEISSNTNKKSVLLRIQYDLKFVVMKTVPTTVLYQSIRRIFLFTDAKNKKVVLFLFSVL